MPVLVHRLGDLHRQLTSWNEDEGTCSPRPVVGGRPLMNALEHGQSERGRLTGSSARLAEQVAAGEERRDGFALNRRGLLVTERCQRVEQCRREAKTAEAVARRGGLLCFGTHSVKLAPAVSCAMYLPRCQENRITISRSVRRNWRANRSETPNVRKGAIGSRVSTHRTTMSRNPIPPRHLRSDPPSSDESGSLPNDDSPACEIADHGFLLRPRACLFRARCAALDLS